MRSSGHVEEEQSTKQQDEHNVGKPASSKSVTVTSFSCCPGNLQIALAAPSQDEDVSVPATLGCSIASMASQDKVAFLCLLIFFLIFDLFLVLLLV